MTMIRDPGVSWMMLLTTRAQSAMNTSARPGIRSERETECEACSICPTFERSLSRVGFIPFDWGILALVSVLLGRALARLLSRIQDSRSDFRTNFGDCGPCPQGANCVSSVLSSGQSTLAAASPGENQAISRCPASGNFVTCSLTSSV